VAGGWVIGTGLVLPDVLKGAVVGTLIALPATFYLAAAVLILRERGGWFNSGLALACLLAGLIGGVLGGAGDLDRVYGTVLAGARGGVFGSLAGMLSAVAVGLLGGRFCSGRTRDDSFGGALGAAFRLIPPPDVKGSSATFAAMIGFFPGAGLGLWCGTVLGVLGYLGEGYEGPAVWFPAAVLAGGLLTLVFFGTRLVLQGAATPRSGGGMLGVALAGALLGAAVAALAWVLDVPVGGPEYWIAGMAGTGALVGAKCWEFLGGDAVSPPLFPF
jgi:hypothetical protein